MCADPDDGMHAVNLRYINTCLVQARPYDPPQCQSAYERSTSM
eukprot:COSAG02_NODE_50488_length_320_cov_0.701357_1_plen_42_part_10